jgi:nucleoside phosphorylase
MPDPWLLALAVALPIAVVWWIGVRAKRPRTGYFRKLQRRLQQQAASRFVEELARAEGYADVAILCVLPEEWEGVCSKVSGLRPARKYRDLADLCNWQVGTIPFGSQYYSAAIGLMARPGPVRGALATNDAMRRWRPRYIFFTGVAGGLNRPHEPEVLNKGDVVIADVIHGYEYMKIDDRFIPRADWTHRTDIGLYAGALAHMSSSWSDLIQVDPPSTPCLAPKVVKGEVASGSKLVEDPTNAFFDAVLKAWPKIRAVEMEGIGAAQAIEEAQALGEYNPVGFMMIRGISDLPRSPGADAEGEPSRGTRERDAWKRYASDTAAAFTISYISSGLPVLPRA